jgi:choline-sulfatase
MMYEASSKVPLIVRLPGGHTRSVPALVSLIDLVPTLLDLAGVERAAMPVLHGTTLLPDLRGEARPERPVFCEMNKTKMIRQGPWKYSTDPGSNVDQLFNLDDDPHELVNLAVRPEHTARIQDFRKVLLDWMINTQNVPLPRGIKE